jgi:hypothetical protein
MPKKTNTPLATYLHDHLGAASFALELLEKWRDGSRDKEFRRFATQLHSEIKRDRTLLRQVIRAVGSPDKSLKEAAGWLAEKATRLKLGVEGDAGLSLFEGLEVLTLGIAGKIALWRMLAVIAGSHPRLDKFDFSRMAQRANAQRAQVERLRLAVGRKVFAMRP